MDDLQDIVKEFLVESRENLDQLDRDLVLLEQDPSSQPELSSVFRTIHTIKGTCGFLGFGKLQGVAHIGENLLSKLRDGEIALRPDITTGLLSLVDAIREILANIESLGAEGEADYAELLDTLTQLQSGQSVQPIAERDAPAELAGGAVVQEAADRRQGTGDRRQETEVGDARPAASLESTVRVDVELLDKLMNRVGELVLARNQILQFTSIAGDGTLKNASQRLNLITTELQEAVMKTRLQPIANVWSKFPRVVRDLALQCGKQVRVELEGQDTELDKSIIESIKDPLTHLVRNAVDHGIEPPDPRQKAGKPAEGRLVLRACHAGGQVNIEISDDGRGLDLSRIRTKAVERGLLPVEQAQRISDHDAAMLIFAPGFSTATSITQISGRGVGMDVVKTNVERIGGTVDIETRPGHGTTIKLKIPLTLAIIPALIIECGGDQYAIPQASLVELVRLTGDKARTGIERIHEANVYRLRGQLLPIVSLHRELDLAAGASPEHDVNIIVLRADDKTFGLLVDAIHDTQEIVVKPLGQQFKDITVFSGATIMGDGKVALILDVLGLARRARVVAENREHIRIEPAAAPADSGPAPQPLLIVHVGDRLLALPIAQVSRLEEIPQQKIERAGNREVVQYRGQILPLFRLSEALGVPASNDDQHLHVVVYTEPGRSLGIVVDRIADIVHSAIDAGKNDDNELLHAVVIGPRVTEVLNLPALIRRMDLGGGMNPSRQYCTFYLDGMFCGVDVRSVQEVIRCPEMTRVPLASRVVSGLMNLRGQIVAAIDLRRRLGLADRPANVQPMNVVVRTVDGPISLLVDDIGDVQELSADSFEPPPPTLSGEACQVIRGAHKLPDRLLLVLDVEQAVAVPQS